jgi:acyl-CoA synthetase (AMP-forming)/AMP-acid ligase II
MNISCRISEISKKIPNKKSVVLAKDGTFLTFKDFDDRSNQIANKLFDLGVRPGMRTLLFVKPCLDFSVITFALFKLGAVPVLIDPGMGVKNLLNSVKQVRPEAMISIGVAHWLRRFKRDYFKSVKIKISLGRVGGGTHFLYKELSNYSSSLKIYEAAPNEVAAILFTSGGTGIPKGVLYTHGILNSQTDALKEMFDLNEDNIDLPGFPLFALFTLAMGMTSVIPEMDPTKPSKCSPDKIVKNIIDYRVTFAAGSPSIWERVGRYCLENNIQLSTVKQIVMFGAPVRYEIHKMFKKVLVDGDTYTPYGATECLPVSLISGSEILTTHLSKMLSGSGTCIGKAVPKVEIKILETSDIPEVRLNELPLGDIGEIAVCAPQVTPGYFEMSDETNKAKIFENGKLWHRMGDLGWLDQDSNLWFLGRKTHRVTSGEITFYPIQVESIFNQHKEIKRSALIKLDVNGGVSPGLVIERFDKNTQMSEDFFNDLLKLKDSQNFTKPVEHFFLRSDFPVDVRHNIKIDRTELSKWAQSQIG